MKATTYAEAKRLIDQAVRTPDGLIAVMRAPTREQTNALIAIGLNAIVQERLAPTETPAARAAR